MTLEEKVLKFESLLPDGLQTEKTIRFAWEQYLSGWEILPEYIKDYLVNRMLTHMNEHHIKNMKH